MRVLNNTTRVEYPNLLPNACFAFILVEDSNLFNTLFGIYDI